jgi:hypothetical protein
MKKKELKELNKFLEEKFNFKFYHVNEFDKKSIIYNYDEAFVFIEAEYTPIIQKDNVISAYKIMLKDSLSSMKKISPNFFKKEFDLLAKLVSIFGDINEIVNNEFKINYDKLVTVLYSGDINLIDKNFSPYITFLITFTKNKKEIAYNVTIKDGNVFLNNEFLHNQIKTIKEIEDILYIKSLTKASDKFSVSFSKGTINSKEEAIEEYNRLKSFNEMVNY